MLSRVMVETEVMMVMVVTEVMMIGGTRLPTPLHFSVNALIQLESTTVCCIITIQAPILKKEYIIAAGVHKNLIVHA